MWLLISLVGLFIVVMLIEHLYWMIFVLPKEQGIYESRMRDHLAQVQVLHLVQNLIDMNEAMYQSTSDYGVPFNADTRRSIAKALARARQMLLDRTGPAPYIIYERPQNSWPFDTEGKVKL